MAQLWTGYSLLWQIGRSISPLAMSALRKPFYHPAYHRASPFWDQSCLHYTCLPSTTSFAHVQFSIISMQTTWCYTLRWPQAGSTPSCLHLSSACGRCVGVVPAECACAQSRQNWGSNLRNRAEAINHWRYSQYHRCWFFSTFLRCREVVWCDTWPNAVFWSARFQCCPLL